MKRYIVEWRPAVAGEQYLFTQKAVRIEDIKPPAVLGKNDPLPETSRLGGNVRPVVVGECDPDEGWLIMYADQ